MSDSKHMPHEWYRCDIGLEACKRCSLERVLRLSGAVDYYLNGRPVHGITEPDCVVRE